MELGTIIIILLTSLAFSALFSGTEIAFFSASKLRVELLRKRGTRKGRVLGRFYDNSSDFLGTMLVGNNIALVVFTFVMNKLLERVVPMDTGAMQLLLYTLLTTIVVLLFGEFLPKTLFRLFADTIMNALAYPLRLLQFVLALPAWLMISLSEFILKVVVRTPVEKAENVFTRTDLEEYIQSARSETDEEIDRNLFEKALYLEKTKVRDCMVPRPEIEYIDVSATMEELEQKFRSTKLSRILVIDGDIDEVKGYVHHQQLLELPESIETMVLEVPFVPEVMRVRDLLNHLIKNQLSLSCVVDEFGGTAGIITLEDILEEIFGEIEDEHDEEDYVEEQLSEREFLFSGRLEISYLNEKYGLDFPDGEYQTLSGYLVITTETIPEQGAIIDLGVYRFVLELVSETKIETVRVIQIPPSEEQ